MTVGGSVGLALAGPELTQGAFTNEYLAQGGGDRSPRRRLHGRRDRGRRYRQRRRRPPQIYGSYGDCMAAGNTLAQQGEAHGFHCVDIGAAPVGVPSSQWKLVIDF